MKKRYIYLISFLLTAAITIVLYVKFQKNTQPVTFVTAEAQFGYIGKAITATGTLQPLDTVSVGAQVSGVVKNVYVDFNSLVKKGQLLAKVDASIIASQTEQARANLASMKSNRDFQKSNFDRQTQLFNANVISKSEYQLALNQYKSSLAAADNAMAQLSLAQKNLSYTNIYAPIDGVVLDRNVSAGQTIASSFNAPTLFVIAKDLTKMQVRAAVDEADIGTVSAGQHVSFTVDAFPADIFEGSVQEILLHPVVSSNVVTYTTLINVENHAMKLKPGMTASINIYSEEDSNALLIPSRALTFKPDSAMLKNYVVKRIERTAKERDIHRVDTSMRKNAHGATVTRSYIWIKKGDTLIERKIVTGISDDTYAKVIKGIAPGDEVITNILKTANTKNNDPQRSPFVPQTQRRSTGNTRN